MNYMYLGIVEHKIDKSYSSAVNVQCETTIACAFADKETAIKWVKAHGQLRDKSNNEMAQSIKQEGWYTTRFSAIKVPVPVPTEITKINYTAATYQEYYRITE